MKARGLFRIASLHLRRSLLPLLLALGFGAGLGLADARLSPRIAANKRAETTRRIPELVPGAVTADEEAGLWLARDAAGTPLGWVLPVAGAGFAGPIELLVGVDSARKNVTGVYVLSQTETPGLGNRVTAAAWLARFRGRPADGQFRLGRDIDGLSGATISSAAVTRLVNAALEANE